MHMRAIAPVFVLRTPKRIVNVKVRAISPASQDLLNATYLVGKSVTLFVGFYCGLQWLHYKQMIDELEQKDDDEKK